MPLKFWRDFYQLGNAAAEIVGSSGNFKQREMILSCSSINLNEGDWRGLWT